MFIFVVVVAFRTDYINKVFGYHLNHSFKVWDPFKFAVQPQVHEKHSTFAVVDLQPQLINLSPLITFDRKEQRTVILLSD